MDVNGEELFCDALPCEEVVAESTCEGDFDENNAVTTGDLLAFLSVFGATCF